MIYWLPQVSTSVSCDLDCILLLINIARYPGDLIVAGSDTISGTLTWMLAILLHYPDVQQRICDEIHVFIREHKRLPSFTDRDSFPYTIAVQKECMRYRPVVHLAFLHIVEKKGGVQLTIAQKA